ncbi:MAG: LptF/LptG family permease [Phycisphaerae bacterium]|nr:LptF/LptG family permease [Phycisphaerae bacterium]
MSRTLFWYVFKDLIRIFVLASLALAGIMSFGGLLRPLTEQGLDAPQVIRVLAYFMPAMQTYSLPVAALFATTMVYGRLAADNELTACRAAGIGYWPIWMPAVVLGLVVATLSLVFLCFIVPVFTLKVEKVIYSNLAKMVANQIEHNHRIVLEGTENQQTVFAQQAFVMPAPENDPKAQVVQLVGPLFVRYERQADRSNLLPDRRPPPPEEFYTATRATAFIHQNETNGEVLMDAKLIDGIKFPRSFSAQAKGDSKPMELSVHESTFTSDPFPSPVRENTKFMNISAINNLLEHPDQSRRIRGLLAEFIRNEQQQEYLGDMYKALQLRDGAHLTAGGGERYTIMRGDSPMEIRGDKLYVGPPPAGKTPPTLSRTAGGIPFQAVAQQIRLRVWPDVTSHTMSAEIDLIDTVMHEGDQPTNDATQHSNFPLDFTVKMPGDVQRIETAHDAKYYAKDPGVDPLEQNKLKKELIRLYNSAVSEKHARVSFAISCLILVMVGCALGMMFKSGNFLSAFALSVVPALMSIVLVVTGQHVCENIPYILPKNFNDPLQMGLYLIWSGNAAVLVIATSLLWKLSRQ